MSVSETLITHTTCPYCGVGCGVEVQVQDDEHITVKGDKSHPSNLGRLCSKGAALGETLNTDNRLLVPQIEGEDVSWDKALDHVSRTFADIIQQHGPDAVAFYVSGQLLTEDYYVANKLMKGFIGSANIDTNSRLCMSSSVAGHKRAFGADTVPCSYTDLEQADLIVLTGSNTAWCHPVLFQRIRAAKKQRPDMRIVVVDPRRTETCEIADLHLPIKPGSDIALFNGLLSYLVEHDVLDKAYIDQHTEGFENVVQSLETAKLDYQAVAEQCDVETEDILCFFDWFKYTEKTVSVYSQGVNQWSFGTDKVNAIINCHLATGRIGKPGQGPFSFTGQPNAMGGREVGGLANQLAAHMDFAEEDIKTVETFWQAPNIARQPGLKAVDLFKQIRKGKVKALWVMATNPAASMPDTQAVKEALRECELLVVSDCEKNTDTGRLANVLLPAATWGEKDGTVTNSERRISRQRAFLPAPGESKPDWWIISEIGKRLGYQEAFEYNSPAEIWCEHAALSGFQNEGGRDFDVSRLADISEAEYAQLTPTQWPCVPEALDSVSHFFADGEFYHPDKKARFISVTKPDGYPKPDSQYPLVLNTGRIRDQWHTMTRTGKVARLSSHRKEPYVEIHPIDAGQYGIADEQLVRLNTQMGSMLAKASVTTGQRRGSLFVPMHWSNAFAKSGKVGDLVNAVTDPISGQPQFKHTPVSIEPVDVAWRGFFLTKNSSLELPFSYWVKQKRQNVTRYHISGDEPVADWSEIVRQIDQDGGDWIEYQDQASGYFRAAYLVDNVLQSCFFVATDDSLPDDEWLDSLFSENVLQTGERASILAGIPPAHVKPAGKTICACFSVGINTIVEAIQENKLNTVEEIGAMLQAGTNCGSCVPELEQILNSPENSAPRT